MPLLDHFHPPLHGPRRWEGFHHAWATCIAAQLNQDTLPPGYFAESEVSLGPELEINVATMELTGPAGWSPPQPKKVVPIHYSTWPLIAQDAPAWAERVKRETQAQPVVLKPGEWVEV